MPMLLPGFSDAVHDAQQTFRSLLSALAEPGKIESLNLKLELPGGIDLASAAACFALLDLETKLWISPSGSDDLHRWIQFHTGCRWANQPEQADFALVLNPAELPAFSRFRWGTPEEPERSTMLLLQVESLEQGSHARDAQDAQDAATLHGPGILGQRQVSPAVPAQFWQDWQQNQANYPLGIDAYLFCGAQLMGLPRSTKAELSLERSPCLT